MSMGVGLGVGEVLPFCFSLHALSDDTLFSLSWFMAKTLVDFFDKALWISVGVHLTPPSFIPGVV